ncbi:MAG: DUF1592 domain-containing protein [Planctomycetaceae bacterium]|nr:DUF1592 domain-containing protein [Planctomycetaceae bacterium]
MKKTIPMPGTALSLMTRCIAILLISPALTGVSLVNADEPAANPEQTFERGKLIFNERCAHCHGQNGEGVVGEYANPLIGDLSVQELSSYIDKTMPEGEPAKCVAEEAHEVASFIHHQFYSPLAQVRNRPPRIELSRLTVRQYRNSVADLVGNFLWTNKFGDEQGLEGNYYKNRSQKDENRVAQRIDHQVNFELEAAAPIPEQTFEDEYTIVWSGAIQAPETGWYQIIVDSKNGFELWFNGGRETLIDGRVKSGDQTEHRAEVFLLEGRAFPIRLQLNCKKADSKLTCQLKWKPPHGPETFIPAHCLTKQTFPGTLVVETDFPPDDRSVGYDRGVQVSEEWYQAVISASVEVVDKIMPLVRTLAKLPREEGDHAEQLKKFCGEFAGTAFRRPLSDELKAAYIDQHFTENADQMLATKRSLLMILQSPRFLFPLSASSGSFDDYDTAAWLALTLWDSVPDKRLLEAAAKGQLNTVQQIQNETYRMVGDDRTKAKVRQFFHQWLYLDQFGELTKAQDRHPDFDARIVTDLRDSVDFFVKETFWSESSDYRKLLDTNEMYVSADLARFYGLPHSGGPQFEKVPFENGVRSGVLTHPFLLAGLSYQDTTSPIHRGVFLSRSLLGRFLKSPPVAVAPTPAELAPDLTTRERVAQQTSATVCTSCHGLINHLGFSLENYDEVGRWRQVEQNQPIDASGYYIDRNGKRYEFAGARELANFLCQSEEAHMALIEQLFQYTTKQPIQAFGTELPQTLEQKFEAQNENMRQILAEIVIQTTLYHQQRKTQVASSNN